MSATHPRHTQNRQPAGVPIGGQFAQTQRSSAAVSLIEDGPNTLEEASAFTSVAWSNGDNRFREDVIVAHGAGGRMATIVPVEGGYHVTATQPDAGMQVAGLQQDFEHLRTAVEVAEGELGWGQTGLETGSRTPWGQADHVVHLAPGITRVDTPSHGGIKLSPERNKEIPPALRNRSGWYEEDCEHHIVGMAFPYETRICKRNGYLQDESAEENLQRATAGVKDWYPDAYEKATGLDIAPGESHVRDQQRWSEAHKDDWVVTSASKAGDDSVEVLARRDGETKKFLVPSEEYRARSESDELGRNGRFVVDPSRHTEVEIPPAPVRPARERHTGINTDALTANQQRLVAKDLSKRYRDETGRIYSVGDLVNGEGLTSKSVAVENGKRQYELRVQEREGDPISVYTVSKATFDAVAAPDDRSPRQIARQAVDIAEHKFEAVRTRFDRAGSSWGRPEYTKAKAALDQARADHQAAIDADKK